MSVSILVLQENHRVLQGAAQRGAQFYFIFAVLPPKSFIFRLFFSDLKNDFFRSPGPLGCPLLGVSHPRASGKSQDFFGPSEVPRTPRKFFGDFAGSSLTVKLGRIKRDNQGMGQTDFCENLRFAVVFCENLRL